jgi:hypothetical protein
MCSRSGARILTWQSPRLARTSLTSTPSASAQMGGPLSGANRKTFAPFVAYATGIRGVPWSSRPEAAPLRLIRIRFVVQISARLARRETDCCKGLRSIGDRSMLHSNT